MRFQKKGLTPSLLRLVLASAFIFFQSAGLRATPCMEKAKILPTLQEMELSLDRSYADYRHAIPWLRSVRLGWQTCFGPADSLLVHVCYTEALMRKEAGDLDSAVTLLQVVNTMNAQQAGAANSLLNGMAALRLYDLYSTNGDRQLAAASKKQATGIEKTLAQEGQHLAAAALLTEAILTEMNIAATYGDYARSEILQQEALQQLAKLNLPPAVRQRYTADLMLRCANNFRNSNDFEKMNHYLQQALALYQRLGLQYGTDHCLSLLALYKGVVKKNLPEGLSLINQVIARRKSSGYNRWLIDDLETAANILLRNWQFDNRSRDYLRQMIAMEGKPGVLAANIANAYSTLGFLYFFLNDFDKGLESAHLAIYKILDQPAPKNTSDNPGSIDLLSSRHLNNIFSYLFNKAELQLIQFGQTGDRSFLQAGMATTLLCDTVYAFLRRQQANDVSQVDWRNRTKNFYNIALELSYQAGDLERAFFFMEKSRAVLLNYQINELGASAVLPTAAARREEQLKRNIVALQLKLGNAFSTAQDRENLRVQLLLEKARQQQFIDSLELQYPLYYQYKYADVVPSISMLRSATKKEQATFIHYFAVDTVMYALAIMPDSNKFVKQLLNRSDDSLRAWIAQCSDLNYQNTHFDSFLTTAYQLQRWLWAPLHVSGKRIIISPDNVLIPFEALSASASTPDFLVQHHTFSYSYSARFLLDALQKKNTPRPGMVGMAPVEFDKHLQLPALKQSNEALLALQKMYDNNTQLLIGKNATKKALLSALGKYNIINLYTHAIADSVTTEPRLFMADSAVHLSELSLVKGTGTSLIILSACQTNTGKLAVGEGIYSLARGFAAAGIPAAIATIWKADEKAVYTVTQMFHEYLGTGFTKDEALQQAKLDFIKKGSREQLLPYYWSNITLTGNYESVVDIHQETSRMVKYILVLLGMTGLLFIGWYWLRKK